MKHITITNATVIPQYKNNINDPDQIIKIYNFTKDEKTSYVINFTICTPQKDGAIRAGRLYEKCSVTVNSEKELISLKSILKNNALISIQGWEENFKMKNGNYIRTIKIKKIKCLSEGIDSNDDIPTVRKED